MSKERDFTTPIAIVVAGAVIAGAVYFAGQNKAQAPSGSPEAQAPKEVNIRGIQKDDLVKGNRDAKIVIVEYSDTECPFCKQFHSTMNKIMEEYGDKVAWVYRFFPLDQLHPKAREEARAVACAAKIGGTDTGFKYLDRMMEITPSNNGLDLKLLPEIADYAGVDRAAFQKCMDSNETAERVNRDYDEAVKSGARGTPHNVIFVGEEKVVVPGGLPYERVKSMLDELLKKVK